MADLGPDFDKNHLYASEINAAAHKYGLPPTLLAGLVQQESNFDPSAKSGAGAVGLTQLMPDTARELGVTDRTDPAQSIDGGAKYLKQQLDHFHGDRDLALAAYNAGAGYVEQYGGIPPFKETQAYVKAVEGYADEFAGGRSPATARTPSGPRTLEFGDRGKDVEALQRAIGVKPDGDFGPKTEAAVRAFQKEHHLEVDGKAGHDTRAAIAEMQHAATRHPGAAPTPNPRPESAPAMPNAGPAMPPAPGPTPAPGANDVPGPPSNGASVPTTPANGTPETNPHPGWTVAPSPAGTHKYLAPNLQEFEKLYAADPSHPKVSVRWDETNSTLSASFTNDKNERFVSTVRTADATQSTDVNRPGQNVVLAPGHYQIAPGRLQTESADRAGTGRAFSQVLNADGTDGIPDVNGNRHTEIGVHGGGSWVARHEGLDAAFADRQELRGTNGCVRLHNIDAASIAQLTADSGQSLSLDVNGRSSRAVSTQDAVTTLRSEGGPSLPAVQSVSAWDGKSHTGTFVEIDDHTFAQHTGQGKYQIFDVDHDLGGHAPPVGQQMTVNTQGELAPGQGAGQQQTVGAGRP